MSKQDMMKIQTCVLRVNIHCEGCMHKVKKQLQKVEGVYKVSIDSEQGKVVVSGNADPGSLIQKLEKAGKHAELWGPPQKGGGGGGGGQFPIPIQLNKFQIESLNKNQKKGNEQQQQQQHQMKNGGFVQVPLKKVSKDDKFAPPKDHGHKSVRFDLPQHEDEDYDDDDYEDDSDFDEFDEDDEFEDEFGEGEVVHSKPPAKGAVGGGGQKPNKAAANAHKGDKGGGKGGGKDVKVKKGGGGIDMFIKGMLKKAGAGGGKNGKSDKSGKKGEKKKEDGGKHGGKKGGFELGDAKKGKNDDGWSKKAGENFHGVKPHQQQVFSEMKHKGGGGGGGGGGRNMEMMGQKGGFPAMNGGGRFAGVGPGNPYNQQQQQQQQYMAQMMMMNQQRENGHEAYHPALAYARPPPPAMSYGPPPGMGYGQPPPHMGYGGPPPPMSYGPPPASAEYTHMFSDENTDSCSIM